MAISFFLMCCVLTPSVWKVEHLLNSKGTPGRKKKSTNSAEVGQNTFGNILGLIYKAGYLTLPVVLQKGWVVDKSFPKGLLARGGLEW